MGLYLINKFSFNFNLYLVFFAFARVEKDRTLQCLKREYSNCALQNTDLSARKDKDSQKKKDVRRNGSAETVKSKREGIRI